VYFDVKASQPFYQKKQDKMMPFIKNYVFYIHNNQIPLMSKSIAIKVFA